MIESRAEAEPREVTTGEEADELALALLAVELDAGREEQLPTREPGRRIGELRDVHPANGGVGSVLAHREVEAHLGDEAANGEHRSASQCLTILSQASASTERRAESISSNCSVSAISGGDNWTTGSPRSSARQIRPRL